MILVRFISHAIHGTGICTYIYHKNQLNVGRSYGFATSFYFHSRIIVCLTRRPGRIKTTINSILKQFTFHFISKVPK